MEIFIKIMEVSATLASINMLLSPMKSTLFIHQTKSVGETTFLPLISMCTNCALWMIYAYIVRNYFPLLITNAIGVLLSSFYSYVFYRYTLFKKNALQFIGIGGGIILGTMIYATYSNKPASAIQRDVGTICCIICVLMYAAPLSSIATVIKTKSAASMPFPIILAGIVNSILWLIYGILVGDSYIFFPNILSVLLGAAQLGVIFKYRTVKHQHIIPIEEQNLFKPEENKV